MTMTRTLTLIAALGAATSARAHPGHDAPAATHWISDLSHLAVVGAVAALAVVVIGAVRLQRRRSRSRGE
jgi:hypothetical protein